jgi:hypothetical protein
MNAFLAILFSVPIASLLAIGFLQMREDLAVKVSAGEKYFIALACVFVFVMTRFYVKHLGGR